MLGGAQHLAPLLEEESAILPPQADPEALLPLLNLRRQVDPRRLPQRADDGPDPRPGIPGRPGGGGLLAGGGRGVVQEHRDPGRGRADAEARRTAGLEHDVAERFRRQAEGLAGRGQRGRDVPAGEHPVLHRRLRSRLGPASPARRMERVVACWTIEQRLLASQ